MKLFCRVILSLLLIISVTGSSYGYTYQTGDYGFTALSGNWGTSGNWSIWNAGWISTTTIPGFTNNVFIITGHTATVEASLKECNNLTVESTAKLYTNDGAVNNNRYVNVYGNIICDGAIGNGITYDNLSFNFEGTNDTISGLNTGKFDASRIRKSSTINSVTTVLINRNVNLTFNNSGFTQLYNNVPDADFNITVSGGDTLNLTNTGNAGIDGIDGNGSGERGGIITVNGVMIVSGTLIMTTDNLVKQCGLTIGSSGVVQTANVNASASSSGKHVLTMNSGGILKISVTSSSFSNFFSLSNNTYTLNSGSTIEYTGSAQYVDSGLTYANIKFSGSGTKTAIGPIHATGNLDIVSPAVFAPASQVYVGGNWTDYTSGAGYTEAGSTVTFNGSSNQSITCSSLENFNNMTVNKPGGKLILSTSPATIVRVAGILNFTQGIIQTTNPSSYLLIQPAGSVINASNTSFVEGPCAKQGTTAFTFPIGKVSRYRPAGISAPASSATVFAEYFKADPLTIPTNVNSKDASLDHISRNEYWLIKSSPSTTVKVTLSWDNTTSGGVDSLPDLRVAAWNSTSLIWKDRGYGTSTGDTVSGKVTADSTYIISVTNIPFTLASATHFNPLPVNMISFRAFQVDAEVMLEWTTASEINNDFFSIERMNDAGYPEKIGRVTGSGNSTILHTYSFADEHPLNNVSYYRVLQVDYDGKTTAYDWAAVKMKNNKKDFILYPNPAASGEIRILNPGEDEKDVAYNIFDAAGKEVLRNKMRFNDPIPIEKLEAGVYVFVFYFNDKEPVHVQFVKE